MSNQNKIIVVGTGVPGKAVAAAIEIVAEHKVVEAAEQPDQFAPESTPYRNFRVPAPAVIDTVPMDGKAKRRERRKAERKNKKAK